MKWTNNGFNDPVFKMDHRTIQQVDQSITRTIYLKNRQFHQQRISRLFAGKKYQEAALAGACPQEDYIPELPNRLISCLLCPFVHKCETGTKNFGLACRTEDVWKSLAA